MDLYAQNLEALYHKYDILMNKDAAINQKIEKKQKEQERKEASIKLLTEKLNDLRYVEEVLRGHYKKEDRKLMGKIVSAILLPCILAFSMILAFLLQMPVVTLVGGLLLIADLCTTNYIWDTIRVNRKPLRQRRRIEASYDLDAVLVEIIDLVNTISDHRWDILALEDDKESLRQEKERISDMLDMMDEAITMLQEARDTVISHLVYQNSSVEQELNKSFKNNQSNKKILKLIKKIEKEEE